MKYVSMVLVLTGLSGCMTPAPTPVIDMAGKDPVQTNRDLAACQVSAQNTFAWGNPVAKCMQARGYRTMGVY